MKRISTLTLMGISFIWNLMTGVESLHRIRVENQEWIVNEMVSIKSVEDIVRLFPKSVAEAHEQLRAAQEEVNAVIAQIIAVPDDQRTFANTFYPLDRLSVSHERTLFLANYTINYLSPDEAMRNACHEVLTAMLKFYVDAFKTNEQLYRAVVQYARNQGQNEQLSSDQRYVLNETIKDWERNGLGLPADQRERIAIVQKEIMELHTTFDRNINDGATQIVVNKDDLAGVPEDFINNLKCTDDGGYILGSDYPTRDAILNNCSVLQTRKQYYKAYNKRAYPANVTTLRELAKKRAELAQMLGFSSYAEFDLDNQMIKHPAKAHEFLLNVRSKSMAKAQKEFEQLVTDLPESIELTQEGKLQPWDVGYIRQIYKQKYFDIDESKIAEYFPMKHTIEHLFDIYQAFFGVQLKMLSGPHGLWHDEAYVLEVHKEGQKLGYLLLDLHPRPNKYSHACMMPLVDASYDEQGNPNGAVAIVIANFTRATETKPSLLTRQEIITFFHEFGHALHHILGRTKMASASGIKVKQDFVEMPSQMLENWLSEPSILKMVSHHYQTGKPLSDDTIARLDTLKQFATGSWLSSQLIYAEFALACFEQPNMDFDTCSQRLYEAISPHVAYDPENCWYTSFSHLTNYGAKYYGYLWSQVFALDLFDTIKKEGLLNGAVGKRYIDVVLSKGGSADPNELLYNFLGRAPTEDAFVKEMGL